MAWEKESAWGDDAEFKALIESVDAMRIEIGGDAWQPPVRETRPPKIEQKQTIAHEVTNLVFSHIDEVLADVA